MTEDERAAVEQLHKAVCWVDSLANAEPLTPGPYPGPSRRHFQLVGIATKAHDLLVGLQAIVTQ